MTKKQYLKQGLKLKRELDHDNDMLRELKKSLDMIQAVRLKERVQGGPLKDDSGIVEKMNKIVELENKIRSEMLEIEDFRIELSKKINGVKDSDEKILLESRYFLFMPWEKIADKLCYSLSHTYKLHGRALENFEFCENDSK